MELATQLKNVKISLAQQTVLVLKAMVFVVSSPLIVVDRLLKTSPLFKAQEEVV